MAPLVAATDADIDEVVELTNLAYRGGAETAGWTVENFIGGQRTDPASLRADIAASPNAQLMLWRDPEGLLLGHVWLEPAEADAWYLGMLTVRPDRQDMKLGRSLLAAAEAIVRDLGGRRVRMTVVNIRDTLIAWYERRGYTRTGETKPFPYGDERFGRPLRDDLEFVVLERRV